MAEKVVAAVVHLVWGFFLQLDLSTASRVAGERGGDLSSREQQRPCTDRMDGRTDSSAGNPPSARSIWQGHLKLIGKEEHDTHL